METLPIEVIETAAEAAGPATLPIEVIETVAEAAGPATLPIEIIETVAEAAGPTTFQLVLRILVALFLVVHVTGLGFLLIHALSPQGERRTRLGLISRRLGRFFIYECLVFGSIVMTVPFYWMVVTAFKDAETASSADPVWTPQRMEARFTPPGGVDSIPVHILGIRNVGGVDMATIVPLENFHFRRITEGGVQITRRVPDPDTTMRVPAQDIERNPVISLAVDNFFSAWFRPEESSRGEVNFLTYFFVSTLTSILATTGTLITSAFAAFAFARLRFWGKNLFFYVILATMMVPGQVLLIPNFLILSKLGMLDTYGALIVPWLASVFTIFLMRQFFMTIPEDLWDAARIDGASRFRYLWQVVVPLSRPVFITAGIFDFLNNWNSLLWPLIVTSSPNKRTLMVGLQNLNDDAGAEFHILMAASCFAILPIVVLFFFLQRFFIEGIARTGLK
jgi:ABC-type glycerol-3-phosphate transport system permease component